MNIRQRNIFRLVNNPRDPCLKKFICQLWLSTGQRSRSKGSLTENIPLSEKSVVRGSFKLTLI